MIYSGPTDLYIAGAWRPAAAGARFTVTDPATGAAIADVADADVTDARAATDAAEKTLPDWARRPPRERAEVLRHVFEAMTTQRDELAELIVRENGKPLADARGEIAYAAEFFRWYSEEAVRAPGSLSLSPSGERRIMTSSRPVGVSLLITPWNLPAAMVTRKVAPALAAGCTVVVNLPSTPRSSRFAWPNCSHWPECRPAWSASCPRPTISPSSATCSNAGRCGCSRSPAPPGWAAHCWPRPPRGSSTARWNWAATRRPRRPRGGVHGASRRAECRAVRRRRHGRGNPHRAVDQWRGRGGHHGMAEFLETKYLAVNW